ncbi:MAG: acyltransferase [Ferruginibacter sp.]
MFKRIQQYAIDKLRNLVNKNKFDAYKKNAKSFGNNVTLVFPLTIEGIQSVSIGDNTAIGTYVHIWGYGGVSIGNRVQIATHASIISVTHDHSSEKMYETSLLKSVVIDDDVWIGANSTILPGITLGKGCVVGAGSVVTKDVPPLAIVAGNPAKVIKFRNIDKSA